MTAMRNSRKRLLAALLALCALAAVPMSGPASAGEPEKAAAVPADAKVILSKDSAWRWHALVRKPLVTVEALKAAGKEASAPATLISKGIEGGQVVNLDAVLPPNTWNSTEFRDTDWPRGPLAASYGLGVSTGAVCLRGKFTVKDPAAVKSLFVTLKYRGGVVVYLNGKEVARADMPEGPVTLATSAKAYPLETYVDAAGKVLTDEEHVMRAPKSDEAARVQKRNRSAGPIEIPTANLRKGLNVLAIASHRSEYLPVALTWWDDKSYLGGRPEDWGHAGIQDAQLLAVGDGAEPNTARPKGVQVWTMDIHDRFGGTSLPEPASAPLEPVMIVGAKNGVFSGAVAVTGDSALKNVKATISDLAGPGGAKIPSAAVQVRALLYASTNRQYDTLTAAIPAEVSGKNGSALPVWFTVRVPKDAAAGEYKGEATISADGLAAPVVCPVILRVSDWTMPDPRDWKTYNGMCQSPDTLAAYYKVPMWSEEHWKLIERSFELMGGLGNRMIHVPLIAKTQLGNEEGMVWWVKKADGTYEYDFTVFDRYLEIAKKHCNLEFVVFHVWVTAGWGGSRKVDQELYVTSLDKASGKRSELRVPVYATDESRAFWKPVLSALRERLAKAGLEKSMTFGNVSDQTGPPVVFKMFSEIAPGICWWRACHSPTNDAKPYPLKDNSLISIHEHVYGMVMADPEKGLPRIWDQRGPGATYLRGTDETDWGRTTLNWRLVPEYALYLHKRGVGRECIDYFPMATKAEHGTFYSRYPSSADGHSIPYACHYAQPGPDGAIPTLRYELFREGMQEAEATMLIAEAAETKADKLGKELVDKCRRVFTERVNAVRVCRGMFRGEDDPSFWQARSAELYATAAEVAAKLK